MSRRDDKYDDEGEDAKPSNARPRRLRREDEDHPGDRAEYKTSSRDDRPARDKGTEDSKPSSPARDSGAGEEPAPKPRRRRETQQDSGGGWMNTPSGARGAPSKLSNTPMVDDRDMDGDIPDIGAAAANQNKHFDMNKDEGEIVMIPDLEDDGGGEGDGRVARAPRNLNRKIPTLAELENDARAAIMMGESGLDMSVLLNTLVPPAMLEEDDVPWSFESLLREITDELLPLLKSDGENDQIGTAGIGQ